MKTLNIITHPMSVSLQCFEEVDGHDVLMFTNTYSGVGPAIAKAEEETVADVPGTYILNLNGTDVTDLMHGGWKTYANQNQQGLSA